MVSEHGKVVTSHDCDRCYKKPLMTHPLPEPREPWSGHLKTSRDNEKRAYCRNATPSGDVGGCDRIHSHSNADFLSGAIFCASGRNSAP